MPVTLECMNGIVNTRLYFLLAVAELSEQQLNIIPDGFNNNIAWQLGHVVSVQQCICYGLSGLPYKIANDTVAKYAMNTKPQSYIHAGEIAILKYNLLFTTQELKKDLKRGIFKQFRPYTALTAQKLTNINDAMLFDAFHGQLHLKRTLKLKSWLP